MADIIPFRCRVALRPRLSTRTRVEGALALALDAVDQLVAALDDMDEAGTDLEPDADFEPSLAAPETVGSQVIWLRGGDQDLEAE